MIKLFMNEMQAKILERFGTSRRNFFLMRLAVVNCLATEIFPKYIMYNGKKLELSIHGNGIHPFSTISIGYTYKETVDNVDIDTFGIIVEKKLLFPVFGIISLCRKLVKLQKKHKDFDFQAVEGFRTMEDYYRSKEGIENES